MNGPSGDPSNSPSESSEPPATKEKFHSPFNNVEDLLQPAVNVRPGAGSPRSHDMFEHPEAAVSFSVEHPYGARSPASHGYWSVFIELANSWRLR